MNHDEDVYEAVKTYGPIELDELAEKAGVVNKDDAFISLVTMEDEGRVEETDDGRWVVSN